MAWCDASRVSSIIHSTSLWVAELKTARGFAAQHVPKHTTSPISLSLWRTFFSSAEEEIEASVRPRPSLMCSRSIEKAIDANLWRKKKTRMQIDSLVLEEGEKLREFHVFSAALFSIPKMNSARRDCILVFQSLFPTVSLLMGSCILS